MKPLFFFVLPCVAMAAGQDLPAGHWEGPLKVGEREVVIAVDLTKNPNGAWACSFSVPLQKATGLRCANLSVAGNQVKFEVADAPNQPSFEGVVSEDGLMNVTISSTSGSLAAQLKRTGEAKVEVAAASPAVDSAFEGDWDGVIETPERTVRLVLHIKNQPDKTVLATLDAENGPRGLPLSDVVQKGADFEFKLRMAGGAFKGKMLEQGAKIEGVWSQGANEAPMRLVKTAAK